ncbi:MAG TPA: anti-sigma F factor [Bacillota bacterium]|nr:anti-sigma F factor [Bacillota bacterium]
MNQMSITFSSRSENESFARVTVASFVSQLNPTLNELTEIKTVVSEAVTNSIIHGYQEDPNHFITISCQIKNNKVYLQVSDKGEGIEDIEQAKEPLYTSKPELERSGMGFTIMENFMDSLTITSTIHKGTKIEMVKQLSTSKAISK